MRTPPVSCPSMHRRLIGESIMGISPRIAGKRVGVWPVGLLRLTRRRNYKRWAKPKENAENTYGVEKRGAAQRQLGGPSKALQRNCTSRSGPTPTFLASAGQEGSLRSPRLMESA